MSFIPTPHISNGSLLLRDSNTDINWYYLSVSILDDEAYLNPAQEAADDIPNINNFSETVTLKAPSGNYYSISVYSENNVIYSRIELLATPLPPNRIFLKANDIYYELVVRADDNDDDYLALILASSTATSDQCTPYRIINTVIQLTPRTISPVSPTCEREILV